MGEKRLHVADDAAMQALGAHLAQAASARGVIYLIGELGAGKTTLVRGYLGGLGHVGPVKSPTYTLIEPYELGSHRAYHLDLYRIGDPQEVDYLGLRDLLEGETTLLVEWPECGRGHLPAADLEVLITYAASGRDVTLRAHTAPAETALLQVEFTG